MLDNGTLPSAIDKKLESACRLIIPSVQIKELPSIGYVREKRGTLITLTEYCATRVLAKNPYWRQLWWDGASRRILSMTTFAADVVQNKEIKPITMQAARV